MCKKSTSLNYVFVIFFFMFSSSYSTANSQTESFSKIENSNTGIASPTLFIESDFTGAAPGANIPWNGVSSIDENISLVQGWSYPKFASATGVVGASDINNGFGVYIDAGSKAMSTLNEAIAQNEYLTLKIAVKNGSINLNRGEVKFTINRISSLSASKYAVFTSLRPFTLGNELFVGSVNSAGSPITITDHFPGSGYGNVSGEIEIRIYMFNAIYLGHKTSLTSFSLRAGDLEVPTAPTALTATSKNSYSIDLSWSPSVDNTAVTGYDVYRDTLLLGTTNTLSFTSGIYKANTLYEKFWVQAHDAAGNVSAASNSVSAMTKETGAENERSPLGMNIYGSCDYSVEHPFINIAKGSRPWGKLGAPWLTYNGKDGRATAAEMTDAKGYLKPGKLGATIVVCNNSDKFWPHTGVDYVCRFEGKGKVQLERDWRFIPVNDGRVVFNVPSGCTDMLKIDVLENDSIDPIRNIWISELKYESYFNDQYNPDKIFYPEYIDNWGKFKVLRSMEGTGTNNCRLTKWQDATGDFKEDTAPTEADFTWTSKGIPVEVLVKLANYTHTDPWFSMPHQATDSYMSNYAKYVSDHLSPNLHCYIEYSNECWNWMFAQSHYCVSQGSLIWGNADASAYHKYYALQSVRMFHLWETVFNNDLSRLVRVFAWQAAGSPNTLLDTEYPAEFTGKAYTHGDALAIGPYFAGSLDGYNSPAINMTVSQILDYCDNYVNTSCASWIKINSTAAKERKLALIAYEGGQHLVASGADKDGIGDSTAVLLDKFTKANADPRMKDLYLKYFDVWRNNGGGMFCNYSTCTMPTKYSIFGSKTYQDQPRSEAPKYDAMLSFIEQNEIWSLENTINVEPTPTRVLTGFKSNNVEVFSVYPGIIHDWLIIQTNAGKQLVTITDLNGKRVFKRQYSGSEIQINTTGYKPGVYIVGLQSEQGVQYKKVIVQ